MKKIYAMFVAALMSVSLFAAPTTSPSKTDLENAGYAPDANVVLCLYFDDAPCNPVMLVGDYAETDNWSLDPSKNKTFAKLAGFDGWYAVEFPWKSGVMAKPVQLKEVDGEYVGSWDFQSGDKDAWVAMDGSAIAEIETENGSESKVVYPAVGAYIYELKYWKNHKSPCVVIPKYNYTIYLFDPECEANDFKPAIIGDFDNWSGTPMSKTTYEGDEAYMYQLTDEADHKIKFREASTSSWVNQLQYKDSAGNWQDFADYVLPAVKNGTDTTIVFDYYDPNQYRYPLCGVAYYKVTIKAALPAGAPAAGVDLMGDFKNGVWDGEGLLMTLVDGKYTAEVEAYESNAFKFREMGNWDNQIQIPDPDSVGAWKNMDNLTFGEWWAEDEANPGTYIIDLDLSDAAEYKWTTPEEPAQMDKTAIYAAFPADNHPAEIEIAFINRDFTWGMEALDNKPWYASELDLMTSAEDAIKFRDKANNAKILCEFIPANGDQDGRWQQMYVKMANYEVVSFKGEMVRLIEELDLRDAAKYAWMENAPEPVEGIENIVLTEKVSKVIVDGVLYIVRDNKMFNLQGVQVR